MSLKYHQQEPETGEPPPYWNLWPAGPSGTPGRACPWWPASCPGIPPSATPPSTWHEPIVHLLQLIIVLFAGAKQGLFFNSSGTRNQHLRLFLIFKYTLRIYIRPVLYTVHSAQLHHLSPYAHLIWPRWPSGWSDTATATEENFFLYFSLLSFLIRPSRCQA